MTDTLRAGVMGDPIGHSLSPRLHSFWLKKHGIDGTYEPFLVKPEDLKTALKSLHKRNIKGVNLTIPHKEAAMEFLDEIDDKARKIGAINTVIVKEDGRLLGTNTDGDGFYNHLKQSSTFKAEGRTAVIIGAGGAARAVLSVLLDAGILKITLVNRTKSRAENLQKILGDKRIKIADWSDRASILKKCDLLVNATSLGMIGQPDLDLDLKFLPPSSIVYDIIYTPLQTNLLKEAKLKGCQTTDGLGMLLHQACGGFKAWFGIAPKVDKELREHMLKALEK